MIENDLPHLRLLDKIHIGTYIQLLTNDSKSSQLQTDV